jgi:APA family basic amino acid/polyamine antiporter
MSSSVETSGGASGGVLPGAQPSLLREMGRWTLTAAVINSVVGSGIFGLPSTLAGLAGPWSPLLVVAAGACIFTVILCFAEVGSRFDQAGGPYLYAREAFGPAAAFHVGWLLLFSRLLSAAAALNILTVYLATLVPAVGTPIGRAAAMTFVAVTITAINVSGIRSAAWTTNVFTVGKLLPLALLAVVGLFQVSGATIASQAVPAPDWTQALLLLVFAYGGFEGTVSAASEARDPKRDTAFALIGATLAVTLLYAILQLVVVGILPDAAATTTPVAAALAVLFGPVGLTLGSAAVVISIYGWFTGFALMMPRVLYSMADRGELPARLAYVHPRFRTPAVAIVVVTTVAWLMAVFSSFAQAAVLAAIPRLGIFIVTCAALVVFRRRPDAPAAAVRVPAGPAFAAAGILFSLWMLSTRSLDQIWILFAVVAAGVAVRAIYAPLRRPRSAIAAAPGSGSR